MGNLVVCKVDQVRLRLPPREPRHSNHHSNQRMAHIQKIVVVRWVIPVPGARGKKKWKRATKETPGAVPLRTETKEYYLFDGRRRVERLYSDKKASETKLAEYEKAKA